MPKQKFSTNGVSYEFKDNTGEILAALLNAKERGLEAIGETAVAYAVKNITENESVDTGRLRNDVAYRVFGDDVVVGVNVSYGPYVEFGTGKYAEGGRPTPWVYKDDEGNYHWTAGNPAKPFLKPAVSDHAQEYRNILIDSLENA